MIQNSYWHVVEIPNNPIVDLELKECPKCKCLTEVTDCSCFNCGHLFNEEKS